MEWLTHSQTGFRQAARYLLGMRLAIITTQLVAIAVAESVITLAHRAEALLVCSLSPCARGYSAVRLAVGLCWRTGLWLSHCHGGGQLVVQQGSGQYTTEHADGGC